MLESLLTRIKNIQYLIKKNYYTTGTSYNLRTHKYKNINVAIERERERERERVVATIEGDSYRQAIQSYTSEVE
jgi:hypothetical protein